MATYQYIYTMHRVGKVVLWIASAVVLLTTAFPWYSVYLF